MTGFKSGTRIFIIRHAESEGNLDLGMYTRHSDPKVPLSKLGHQQALAAGDWLAQYYKQAGEPRHVRMYVSPFLRTEQTAAEVAKLMGMRDAGGILESIQQHPLLKEQAFGLFEGLSDLEQQARYPDAYERIGNYYANGAKFYAPFEIVGGESPFKVYERAKHFLGTLIRDQEHNGQMDFVIVTHGVTARALAMALDRDKDDDWFAKEPNPGNADIRLFVRENGHMTDKGYVFRGQETGRKPAQPESPDKLLLAAYQKVKPVAADVQLALLPKTEEETRALPAAAA
ncbi:hypothetical protein GC177_08190 [bacterium]|nr:hypothetical protein [bacterium]